MFNLRQAETVDLEALYALEKLAFEKPWSRSQLLSLLKPYAEGALAREFALILEDTSELYACIAWQKVLDEASLLSIAVHPDYRRQGLASRLLSASELYLKAVGVKRILLEVSEKNVSAQNFYLKAGFKQDGKRSNYYGVGEAAWLMSRTLV